MKKVGIINCSTNNLFSINNIIKELGYNTIVSDDKKDLERCDYLILPGVGAFFEAKKKLNEKKLDFLIYEFIKKGNLFLGICLGFQLLFEESSEFKKTKGLDLIKGKILPFESKNKIVPHVGWNKVINIKNNLIDKTKNKFYFIHSFYANEVNENNILFKTKYYDLEFCSGVNKENIYGFQFHPEKSGLNGFNLLNKVLKDFK